MNKNFIIRNNLLFSLLFHKIDWNHVYKMNIEDYEYDPAIIIEISDIVNENKFEEYKEIIDILNWFVWNEWNILEKNEIIVHFDANENIIFKVYDYKNNEITDYEIILWQDIINEHFFDENGKFISDQTPLFWIREKWWFVMIETNWKRKLNYYYIK